MLMSDIFDIPLVLFDDGKYYELEFYMYSLEQPTDFPYQAFLEKGKRIYNKNIYDYRG
jgi:hypothetical protein